MEKNAEGGPDGVHRFECDLSTYFDTVRNIAPWKWTGRVIRGNEQTIESEGPPCSIGESCEVLDQTGRRHAAEVIGFRESHVLCMPLDGTAGLRYGDVVQAKGCVPSIGVGEGMLGRIFDACGTPIDDQPKPRFGQLWMLDSSVRSSMEKVPIRNSLQTGIRVIDGMLTVGRGQRIGIFGGSGVGKSTLIGMMTRNTEADLTVIGLVGERGREVREFVEESLGDAGRDRSVVLVSTSDQSPLLRMRAAQAATAVAEFYASKGLHVLLVLDSLTRYAMAAREIGLAAGEPPATKGYTPSVFTRLAKLVERAGNFEQGSITAFYTVLMEGDDQQDPIVDSVRSLLDGHIVLSRDLAAAGQYPPIDVVDSLSRLMPALVSYSHFQRASLVRGFLAIFAKNQDLIRIGAYRTNSDPELDRAIAAVPVIRSFLEQDRTDETSFERTVERLLALSL